MNSLTKKQKIFSWIVRLTAAVILLQTLFFKFTGAPESVYIFTKVGMEPWGRYGTGVVELVASILLLSSCHCWLGAALALGVMGGAIFSHLTVLGIVVQDDGGLLFALAITVAGGDGLTLLAFLSSGCATCSGFWQAFRTPDRLGLPVGTRLVVVTKGPEMEIPAEVAAQAPAGLPVVMSTDAWSDYEVPGSPFFVLVDGASGRRIGEGVANHFHQVVELVRRAASDARVFTVGSRSRGLVDGLDGPERELDNDRELIDAGILPGDPSLYPSSLDDVYGRVHGEDGRGAGDRPPVSRAG